MTRNSRGFSLIELMVVVLIIGILAAIALPQYNRAVEQARADEAAALVKLIGNTNRMYRINNANTLANGGPLRENCNAADCDGLGVANHCRLVACNYLARESWDRKPYDYSVGAACGGGNLVACARRCTAGGGDRRCTNTAPFNGWGYNVDVNGVVTRVGNAPLPPAQ